MSLDAPAPIRVSTLELFFDLVFVFTITQVSTVVVRSPDGAGLLHAVILLAVIYWMYDGYAWMTNVASAGSWRRTTLLLVGMGGFFVCALAVPRVFEEDGLAFALGYLVVTLVHLAGFLLHPRTTPLAGILGIAPKNLVSAVLLLFAAFTRGALNWVLWTSALALQVVTPMVTRRIRGVRLHAGHFAERHSCMILIVLGESLVSVGLAAQSRHLDLRLALGALAGLAANAAMWWAYFVGEDQRAVRAFEAAPLERRVIQAVTGYELANMIMICGVIAVAAGTRLRIEHFILSPAPVFEAWLIAVGAMLFLLGEAGFRLALGFGSPWPRSLGSLLCLGAVAAGRFISAAAGLAAVAVAITATLIFEHWVERSAARWARRLRRMP